MKARMEKLLENIDSEKNVTGDEAEYIKKLKEMQQENPMLCMKYLIKYYNAKLCR